MKKMYAGVTNVFESQPNFTCGLVATSINVRNKELNDYFWMTHDGQGAGLTT
ncbi:hypothetical protein O9993_16260 [Vibrio lentus]|nr:hypothetical protein [Vibrio lentus]